MLFKLKLALLCLVSALILMGVCFYNGYPMYDGDTHAYLSIGFSNAFSRDRPPFYGIFLRMTSLWTSLWLPIFAQNCILSFLLWRYVRLLFGHRPAFNVYLSSVIVIAAFTCVSWVSADLMPDVFAGILLVGVILFLFDKDAKIGLNIIYLLIISLAVFVHSSHFAILFLFAVAVLLYAIVRKHKIWVRKAALLISVCLSFYCTMCVINLQNGYGFVFSSATKIFTMARLAQTGILDLYLHDSCKANNLRLCSCQGHMPVYPWGFMWPSASSPLSQIGIWDSCGNEFSKITHDVFTTPKYLRLYMEKSGTSTLRQLFTMQVEKPMQIPLDNWQGEKFKTYFEDEFIECTGSLQNNGNINTQNFNLVYNLFAIFSSLLLLLFYHRFTDSRILKIYISIFCFFLINACITSTLSMVYYRFQYRIFWLLPATNAILIIRYLYEKYRDRTIPV